jgi:rubrerythrin
MEISKEEQVNFHEFSCLGCHTTWLMKEGQDHPKYCPGCGSMFGEFIARDIKEYKN